jgi:adenosylcobinamide kinase/adenosylcobinamide-phosphate guanylyltransferase
MTRITLVLGGARSGKSRYAEQLGSSAKKRTYIATAEIIDEEMRERIARHRTERGDGWVTSEAPLNPVAALRIADAERSFILIDCITLWLGNLMHHGREIEEEVGRLCEALGAVKGHIVIVANEVGLGIVPDNALARRFRDEAGRANQQLAQIADEVIFMAAGLPIILKKRSRSRSPKGRATSKRGHRA